MNRVHTYIMWEGEPSFKLVGFGCSGALDNALKSCLIFNVIDGSSGAANLRSYLIQKPLGSLLLLPLQCPASVKLQDLLDQADHTIKAVLPALANPGECITQQCLVQ